MSEPSPTTSEDKHVHLHVIGASAPRGDNQKQPWDWARWLVIGAGVLAAICFAVSFFLPWWRFWLYAPQYPSGLSLVISLTGMGGDVAEIDLLNHYIGMKHLATAAPTERQLGGYGVAAIAVVTAAAMAISGRKLNKFLAIPALSFPTIFLLDSFYWLYSFGHQLDPHAPLHISAFTPEMFGNGQIGQFETFAKPDVGFWVALCGVVFALVSTFLRSRVCDNCVDGKECGAVCPRAMVLPDRKHRTETGALPR